MSAGVPPSTPWKVSKVGTQVERPPRREHELKKENESPWLKHSG